MTASSASTDDLDTACLTAHGAGPAHAASAGALVAVFAGAVAHELLLMGARAGYAIGLVEPDPGRCEEAARRIPGLVAVTSVADQSLLGPEADVVVTDHHRDELGVLVRDALAASTRWVGVMGTPRHVGPHVAALRALEVPDSEIARVHRPIGLNIGSRTPAEIAISTLAGLIATRSGRPGGFHFD